MLLMTLFLYTNIKNPRLFVLCYCIAVNQL